MKDFTFAATPWILMGLGVAVGSISELALAWYFLGMLTGLCARLSIPKKMMRIRNNMGGLTTMKTIGLIGGMSWESTVPYYQIINEYVKEKLGGLHSAKIILYSVEFAEIEKLQSLGNWEKCGEILSDAAKKLELAGADMILICTNTMHIVYTKVQSSVNVPVIHIAKATALELKKCNVKTVALLGTNYTMTKDFYKQILVESGFLVLVPNEEDMELVNDVIFKELCVGIINPKSRKEFSRIISGLKNQGAEAVILGCTEIGLLVKSEDSVLKIFDTTEIHAKVAASLALDE